MRSLSTVLLLLPLVAGVPSRLQASNHFLEKRDNIPSPTTEVQDGQTGTLIVLPPQATETGLKQIPGILSLSVSWATILIQLGDADHPFIAPGPDDQRGRK